uniref:Uncharacterized protein n=1 Tax=Timema cristinae TaxID=61476 RepID=A0A7R9GV97_TIMCR|nr:unnamed protein product [Timema cristinae]
MTNSMARTTGKKKRERGCCIGYRLQKLFAEKFHLTIDNSMVRGISTKRPGISTKRPGISTKRPPPIAMTVSTFAYRGYHMVGTTSPPANFRGTEMYQVSLTNIFSNELGSANYALARSPVWPPSRLRARSLARLCGANSLHPVGIITQLPVPVQLDKLRLKPWSLCPRIKLINSVIKTTGRKLDRENQPEHILEYLALSSASLKPILWDGVREGERHGVASQPIKVSFRANKNRWITETVDGASYRICLVEKSYVWEYQFSRERLALRRGGDTDTSSIVVFNT